MINIYLCLCFLVSVHGYSRPQFSLRNFSVDEYEVVCIQSIYEGSTKEQRMRLKHTMKDKKGHGPSGLLRTGLCAESSVAPNVAVHYIDKVVLSRVATFMVLRYLQEIALMKLDTEQFYGTATAASDPSNFKCRNTEFADPYETYIANAHQNLFGPKVDDGADYDVREKESTVATEGNRNKFTIKDIEKDSLAHYPCGQLNRAEVFHNKSAVHLPPKEFIHRGHACLQVTSDHMQTAINAFAILLEGKTADVAALPSDYVLRSARAISMMKIAREKLAALWNVVKKGRKTVEVQHYELEMFRPLFKYVNAREMARLNLSDDRILTYLGTHYELDRHQVGVVASRYIELNTNWTQVQNLNKMNNLLCGVPMVFMRKVPAEVYLQLTYQIFYHIRACDPLQRRFYLSMMTRTEALGKSFSWSAQDVSRLGLLLAEVGGPNLANINPEAISGITAQVMMEMRPDNLMYFSEPQLRYLGLKPLNIMARKLKAYHDIMRYGGGGADYFSSNLNIKFISLAILHVLCLLQ